MPFEKGNKLGGRKGFGLEYQKKRVLDQAFHTLKKSMTKEGTELTEKEKIAVAEKIVLKEIGNNIDITSKGEKIVPILGGITNKEKEDVRTDNSSE
ncbi:MAG: hypothetical protein GY849_23405 [Deltaproteobacteria bacterium]|nr:hypothetical protein [Deltaproteobacteria bacterium]